MSLNFRAIFVPFFIATVSPLIRAQAPAAPAANPVVTIPAPNNSDGWCYYCSDEGAPPLCNAQCTTAINRLCGENLKEALTSVEQDCEIQYLPPSWEWRRNGAHGNEPSEAQCIDNFNHILQNCGKDAGTQPSGVDQKYCTPSGGGGTYGWNDDGSPVANSGRYIIKTKGTEQCGQAKAPWQQATSVIKWDPSWVGENDQVVLITDVPASAAPTPDLASIPAPNPECANRECNIFGEPYYAESPEQPWQEGDKNMRRHRVVFEGWDPTPDGKTLFYALQKRCQQWPNNWAYYKNGTQNVADFDLPTNTRRLGVPYFDTGEVGDYCWCIPYALFEASAGITLPVNSFCDTNMSPQFPSSAEFAPARKRGLELEGQGLFKSVEKVVEKRKRDLIQDISGVEREWA